MPLTSIFKSTPESVDKFNIEQVVSVAGDGVLKDDSSCSAELRDYLGMIGTEKISSYIDHCLTSGFAKSGLVLQDLVNELGRRLDYQAINGRYQGVTNQIGFDGICGYRLRAILSLLKLKRLMPIGSRSIRSQRIDKN